MATTSRIIGGQGLAGADALRALACLGVYLAHAGHNLAGHSSLLNELAAKAGNLGVSCFFVLSGFLLAQPFWKAFRHEQTMPDLRVYAVRRLGRIVPGYVVCLGVEPGREWNRDVSGSEGQGASSH